MREVVAGPRVVKGRARRFAIAASVAWLTTGCELLFDDDPCAGTEPSSLGTFPFTSTSFCDGDDVMTTHQCLVEGEPTAGSYATFERDCSVSGAQCVAGTCVSRTETCPDGHTSFCDASGLRHCVDQFVGVGAITCDEGQRCIEVDDEGAIRAQCALSDVPCTSERGMCEGDVRVSCQQGFPVSREACEGIASHCVESGVGYGVCIAPECSPGMTADICVGDVIVSCSEYGSRILADCGSQGKQCGTQDSGAFCLETGEIVQTEWAAIPGGSFTFRTNGGEPELTTLPGFEIMTTEVTWAQFQECVDAGVCSLAGGCFRVDANRPLHCAEDWMGLAFCRWTGGRLPAETEWQYVATNFGTAAFPWGDAPPSCDLAALGGADAATQACATAPVDVCSAAGDRTELGVCDMAGNVRELVVRPGFPESPYCAGGSFATPAAELSLLPNEPRTFDEYPYVDVGFRCVR